MVLFFKANRSEVESNQNKLVLVDNSAPIVQAASQICQIESFLQIPRVLTVSQSHPQRGVAGINPGASVHGMRGQGEYTLLYQHYRINRPAKPQSHHRRVTMRPIHRRLLHTVCAIDRNMMTTNIKKPVLYVDEASPPARFTMMTASVLNIDLEFYKIDIFKSEQKSDFFKKLNPLQKVPVLAMDGEVICDSHAIALHLCRLTKNNDLYPEDIILKAKIDEMLYFNSGILFPVDSAIFSAYFAGEHPVDEKNLNKWYSALDYLELKLNKYKFLTGDKMRLCDICCGSTVTSLELIVPLLEQHEKVKQWLENLRLHPCFKINAKGIKRLKGFVNNVSHY